MVEYDKVEDDVITALATIAGVEIVPLPESEALQNKTVNAKITVAYGGSEYTPTEGLGNIVQREKVKVVLFFECRLLRSSIGLYPVVAAAKSKLLGFEPTYCGKLFLEEQSPMKRENNLFSFYQTYATYTMISEDLPDENGAPLNPVTFNKV